jgi:uncharacterized NAD-dependent epimerase/dehydratase family protein
MNSTLLHQAIVYCEGAFNTPNGKTAHGLVRFTKRYQVLTVIDSHYRGEDAGNVLDGQVKGIPIVQDLNAAIHWAKSNNHKPTHFVIGLAPDGGKLSMVARETVKMAIQLGLNIDSGLHDFLSEDNEILDLAQKYKIQIRDIRKPPPRNSLHFFSGKIEEVKALKVAVLGTDSAVGKRTSAWLLVQSLQESGLRAELIGTGQTAWMQGASYTIMLDSLINDFVTGEIEHVIWQAWQETKSDVLVIEGQGSLLNPAYPGGYEILAAGRPDVVILQHAPSRKDYDGFPGYPIQPLPHQVHAIEVISAKKVIAITLNHENLNRNEIKVYIAAINDLVGIPTFDVLSNGAFGLAQLVASYIKDKNTSLG